MMTQRGLFRVLLKTLGVYFIVHGGVACLYQVVSIVRTLLADATAAAGPDWLVSLALSAAYNVAIVLAGVYLLTGGRFLLDRAFPRGARNCQECGYDISKTTAPVCPECAAEIPAGPPGHDLS